MFTAFDNENYADISILVEYSLIGQNTFIGPWVYMHWTRDTVVFHRDYSKYHTEDNFFRCFCYKLLL